MRELAETLKAAGVMPEDNWIPIDPKVVSFETFMQVSSLNKKQMKELIMLMKNGGGSGC